MQEQLSSLSWDDVKGLLTKYDNPGVQVYGVPKGGMIAASMLQNALQVYDPKDADLILDDIVDSGNTRNKYHLAFPLIPFVGLVDKTIGEMKDKWVIFPWEADHPNGLESIQQNIVRQLQYIGEDPKREGLLGTPDRIVRSWNELYAGYKQNPADVFTVFEADGYDQIVLLKDCEVWSMCEHHNVPFGGKAHVAYIPNGKVIGISKLARLVDIFARRMQIQERIGEQVTEALMTYLQPKAAACILDCVHLCMRMRGVGKQHSSMVTSSLKGVFMDNPAARSELMGLIK